MRAALATRTAAVIALTGAIAAAAVLLLAVAVDARAVPAAGFGGAFVVVALLFAAAEATPVHLHFRSQAHSMSLNDIALVFGLFTLGAVDAVAAITAGGIIAVSLRRQRPIKAAFNLAQYALTASVAAAVFHPLLEQGDPFGVAGWTAAAAAACGSAVLGVALVSTVIRIAGGGGGMLGELPLLLGLALASSAMSTCVALIAVTLLHDQPASVWLVAVPALACVAAFTVTVRQQHRRRHTEVLYGAMRRIQEARGLAQAVAVLLAESRAIVAAADAVLVLLPRDGEELPLVARSGDVDRRLAPAEVEEVQRALEALSGGATAVLGKDHGGHPLGRFVRQFGLRDALVVALRDADDHAAILCIGNRLGDVATFTAADAALVTTFAQHAAVVLENDRMLDELRRMAYVDGLTGLPNRAQFTLVLERALRRASSRTTVLFIDIDDFKTVNDSLGHTAGDELLAEVGRRLPEIAEEAMVSRFGGDEFAILLDDSEGADAVGEKILAMFGRPFHVGGHEVRTAASIGIAFAGEHAGSVEELLRNADAALYAAKDRGKRAFAMYVPELHERATRRQELASALERGIGRGELEVHYQPITTLADGSVYAFEALVRWRHPDLGLLAPGAFIALAEERGLAGAITRHVLADACARTASWRGQRPELAVSVNVSPSDFLGPTLVSDVRQALERTGLPPHALLLEITEQTALHEPGLTVSRLKELRHSGVRVALDDFGTGYSSLAQLRNLPIDCLKIAKELVDGLEHPTGESVVVAIAQLAQAFELDVVAEGIETPAAAAVVSRYCARGQGYHFAAPLPPDAVPAYLAARAPSLHLTPLAVAR